MGAARTGTEPDVTPDVTDGRRRRGVESRERLLDAALRVIEREGVAGVTHRKVTMEAGLPATSAAYHFASINDLLEAALRRTDEESGRALDQIASAEDSVAALAEWLVRDFAGNQRRCVAEYELFLYAARSPSLRPAALRWLTDLLALAGTWTPDPAARRRIAAYVDGLLVQSLVGGEMPPVAEVEQDLRALLRGADD